MGVCATSPPVGVLKICIMEHLVERVTSGASILPVDLSILGQGSFYRYQQRRYVEN